MKKILALAVILMSTSMYAVDLNEGNTMGQEQAPRVQPDSNSRADRMESRKMHRDTRDTNKTYGTEMNNDSISTGQSATRRKSLDTPSKHPAVSERCIDNDGYSYEKNDSGFAACVNQGKRIRNR